MSSALADAGPVQAPSTLWVPPRRGSYGPEIVDWAESIGISQDPEQRRDTDALASFGPGGKWVTLENCVIEGRQNGKTKSVLLPLAMADIWLFSGEPDRVVWTSHLVSTSLDTFTRIKQLIDANPSLSRRVQRIQESKTEQGVFLHNGSSIEFYARTARAGRGLGGKHIVFDEALFLSAGPMGALLPILSARANPRITYGSSAGMAESSHLRALQRRGRAGGDPSLTFIEYRADGSWAKPGCVGVRAFDGSPATGCPHTFGTPGCQLDVETNWFQANHAMGRGRIAVEFVRAERRTLPPAEFGRERCGWEELGDEASALIDVDDWTRTTVPDGFGPGRLKPPVFYLDVGPMGRSASVGVAADRVDGSGAHVELASHRLGSAWLPGRAAELFARHPNARFAGSTTGGLGAHLPALRSVGIKPWSATKDQPAQPAGTLRLFTDVELAGGCAHFQTVVSSRPYRVTHSADPLLVTAIAGAAKRDLGDGLWLLTRRGEQLTELSPLYAEVGALWLLETCRPADYQISRSIY